MAQDLSQIRSKVTKLRDELRDGYTIDLNRLRGLYKELDDLAHQQGSEVTLLHVADLDREIIAANAAKCRLVGELNKLLERLGKS